MSCFCREDKGRLAFLPSARTKLLCLSSLDTAVGTGVTFVNFWFLSEGAETSQQERVPGRRSSKMFFLVRSVRRLEVSWSARASKPAGRPPRPFFYIPAPLTSSALTLRYLYSTHMLPTAHYDQNEKEKERNTPSVDRKWPAGRQNIGI